MKILAIILTLSSFHLYACNYSLKIKIKPNIRLSSSNLRVLNDDFTTKMDELGYVNGGGSSEVSLFYTTIRDIHNPRLIQARVALSYKTNGRLEYYTQGLGNPNRSRHDATIVEEFQQAIATAVSNLPECI